MARLLEATEMGVASGEAALFGWPRDVPGAGLAMNCPQHTPGSSLKGGARGLAAVPAGTHLPGGMLGRKDSSRILAGFPPGKAGEVTGS